MRHCKLDLACWKECKRTLARERTRRTCVRWGRGGFPRSESRRWGVECTITDMRTLVPAPQAEAVPPGTTPRGPPPPKIPASADRLHILPRVAPSGLRGVPDWSLRTGPDSRGSLVLVVLVRAHAREGPSRPDHPLGASVAPARSSGWCRTSGSKMGAMPGPAAPGGPLRRENG